LRYSDATGRRREVGLGSAFDIPLQMARDKALELRQSMRLDGVDPIQAKEAKRLEAQASITFAEAVTSYLKSRDGTWGNEKHAEQWQSTLDKYAMPMLGGLPVAAIMPSHVAEALRPIWVDKHETAARTRQRVEAVLAYADTQAHRQRPNPARLKGSLDHLLPKVTREVAHHAALPWKQAPKFMARLREAEGLGARALEFAILTAARSGEVRGATWAEIHGKTWVVPAARMKGGREHRVPLSAAALAVLKQMPHDASGLIFPSRGKPMSDMAMAMVLKRMEVQATVHGFRSTFRDWCGDTGKPRELAEMALAHAVGNEVEAAYARSGLLERRAKLMAEWAAFLGV
jgi:integrase